MTQVEVLSITDTGHRRRWTDAGKLRIVEEIYLQATLEAIAAGHPQSRLGEFLLKRPGFTGEFFVQNLRGFFKGIHVRIELLLRFLRRDITDGAVQPL